MNKIKGYRNMIGFSQKEMGKVLGIAEATYRNKENGKSSFKESEIELFYQTLLAKGVDIKVSDIFFTP